MCPAWWSSKAGAQRLVAEGLGGGRVKTRLKTLSLMMLGPGIEFAWWVDDVSWLRRSGW